MSRFEGQVALVTGGSRGIGAAVARYLATEGADVVISYKEQHELAAAVVADIEAAGRQALSVAGDLTSPRGPRDLLKAVKERFGRLDILVPAAGNAEIKALEDMDIDTWQRSFAIHLEAVLQTAQAAHPMLKESGGRVVLLSAVGASAAFTGYASVGAAKAGLESLLQYMASEWIKDGVRVNAVSCGTVDSGILERWPIGGRVRTFLERKTVGVGIAQPEDIAPIVAFLASPESRYIVGQSLVADGGVTLGIDFEQWVRQAYGQEATFTS